MEEMTPAEVKKAERAIGRKAAKMAEVYLHQVIRQKLKIHNEGFPEGSLLDDTRVKSVMGEYRFLGLNLQSSKAGFILNYGFIGVRNATKVYFNDPRFHVDSTQRKSHPFALPPQQIFEDFYQKSGTIDFLISELSRTRAEALQYDLTKMALKLSKEQDGK